MNKKKNRVLILYHTCFGRNDGPPLYYFNQLRQRADVEAIHLVPQGDISKFGKFDYTFWVDYGEDGLPVDHSWKIPKSGGKTIYIASDTHLDNGYRLKRAKDFDYAFFNQKKAVEEYDGQSMWLPHAMEPQAYPNFEILKKYDVCFIGHIQTTSNYNNMTRLDSLDRMFKEFPNFYFGARHPAYPGKNLFEDAAKRFCESRIVFNISIKDDINMRVFEVMGTGSFLLTNWLPTLEELFEDGKHLVTYKTIDEAVEKAKYYLKHEAKREKIAKAGMREVLEKHTYAKRIDTIFDMVSL